MTSLALTEDRIWGDRYLVVSALVLASVGLLSVFCDDGNSTPASPAFEANPKDWSERFSPASF